MLSRVQLCNPVNHSTSDSSALYYLREVLKFMPIELVMRSNHLILCFPLLLTSSVFPSNRVFSNKSALCIWWPKSWSFSFSIRPSNECPGLVYFKIDCFDIRAIKGSQESSLAARFKTNNSSVLSLLYDLTLTSRQAEKP